MKINFNTIVVLIAVVVLALAAYFGMQKADQALKIKAYHDCAQDYHLEYNDVEGNTKITRPLEEFYRQCLQEKGY